jgi:flagellar motor switch protein FliN
MTSDRESKPGGVLLDGKPGAVHGLRGALVSKVDVAIETFLGGVSMTIGELNALQPGGVVTLDAALNQLVELRMNGVTIAHGELVAVGDKFGVRVTSLSP